jgi:hypothetical protein
MKKLIIPVTSLLLLAGNVMAADTTNSAQKQSNANSKSMLVSATATVAYSYEMLVEENIKLRQQADLLTNQVDDLSSKLGYTQMMHTTLTNLDKTMAAQTAENLKDQMDYARMMHVTLTNLAVVATKAN